MNLPNFSLYLLDEVKFLLSENKPIFSNNIDLAKFLFEKGWNLQDKNVQNAHIQAIQYCLQKEWLLNDDKNRALHDSFASSVTFFNQRTKIFNLKSGAYSVNYVQSICFYYDAKGINHPMSVIASLPITYIPLKLRLAIEIYFKNLIGYVGASQKNNKGEESPYILNISKLLSFFNENQYSKYVKLPVDIAIIQAINFWSNHYVHTGIISFTWQSLLAIDLLEPLFRWELDISGFNYLNRAFSQKELIDDLNNYLSNKQKKVTIYYRDFEKDGLLEGKFYYDK